MSNSSQTICFLLVLLAVFFTACKEPAVEPDLGYDYYPLQLGTERVYQIGSVIYDPNGMELIDTISFQWRESLVDTFSDEQDQTWYRIERHKRNQEGDPWVFHSVVTESRDATRAFRKENNLLFIPFIFPPDPFANWESTVFFDDNETVVVAGETLEMFKYWESRFEVVEESMDILGEAREICTLSHANFENLIELRRVFETYAAGLGLVERSVYILDTQEIDAGKPWEEKAEKGFILQQTLIKFQ
ncbi:MAG: hypothetical protein GYB31_12855 [Bacteroidetes bacterium]|nr:hypothetical protein [Bacteroidota bacterium]